MDKEYGVTLLRLSNQKKDNAEWMPVFGNIIVNRPSLLPVTIIFRTNNSLNFLVSTPAAIFPHKSESSSGMNIIIFSVRFCWNKYVKCTRKWINFLMDKLMTVMCWFKLEIIYDSAEHSVVHTHLFAYKIGYILFATQTITKTTNKTEGKRGNETKFNIPQWPILLAIKFILFLFFQLQYNVACIIKVGNWCRVDLITFNAFHLFVCINNEC